MCVQVHPRSRLPERHAHPGGRVSYANVIDLSPYDLRWSYNISWLLYAPWAPFGSLIGLNWQTQVRQTDIVISFWQEWQRFWPDAQTNPDIRQRDAGDTVGWRLRQRGLCECQYSTDSVFMGTFCTLLHFWTSLAVLNEERCILTENIQFWKN